MRAACSFAACRFSGSCHIERFRARIPALSPSGAWYGHSSRAPHNRTRTGEPLAATTAAGDNVLYHSLSALASAEVNFWFTCRRKRLVASSGRVWRKVPDDILSYLGVGLRLSARRLPPPLLRPCFVALPATWSEAHSSLSPNQLHEGFNLLRNLSAVGAEILLKANSAKKCDD